MKRLAFALAIALFLFFSLFTAAQTKEQPLFSLPVPYNFVNVSYPHAIRTVLFGINLAGYTVGFHFSEATGNKGFTLSPSRNFAPENYPGSIQTVVAGINSNFFLPGGYETSGWWNDKSHATHGFMHNSNTWTDVDYPGTAYNELQGMNDNDVAAGFYVDGVGDGHPYIYSQPGNQFTPLSVLQSTSAYATDINDSDEIVGFYVDMSGNVHGFAGFAPSSFAALNYPGAYNTYATGINSFGYVVGYYNDATGYHAFIQLANQWEELDDPGAIDGTYAYGINDNFDIVGEAINSSTTYGFVATPE